MKVITKEEFDSFPVVDGYKQCPSGDYSKITLFQDRCTFGDNCKFGSLSNFIRCCIFGENCIFGDDCNFIQRCYFGSNCSFGICCNFGKCCIFSECKIGHDSSFGECCIFEGKCIFENEHVAKTGYPLLTFNGFGSVNGTIYFFNCEDGIFVRYHTFFGTIEQFKEQFKYYLMISDFVEKNWR